MNDQNPLLARLQNFVRSEAEAQRFELRHRWAMPLPERVQRGRALEGLAVEQLGKHNLVRLHCKMNESRFREGDMMVLHRGDPEGEEAIECLLEYDDETVLEVTCTRGNRVLLSELPEGWIADESMLDLSEFYLDALNEVADTLHGRQTILPMLSDEIQSEIDFTRYEDSLEDAHLHGLDDSQCEAVALAYSSSLFHLIQGPPGTGKTYVLAHLVRQLIADGERVLITALTHRAINNALNKIARIDPALPICKVGIPVRADDLEVANYANFVESGFGDLPGGYAVGATPFATRSERLSHVEFDVVVFDEASQITLPLAIMGMLPGEKYVFIGDEHQLPPVCTLSSTEFGRTSIFGYLSGRGSETMLTTTYRLNNELAEWPSRTFYDGAIQPSAEAARRRLNLRRAPLRWRDVLDPEQPLVFVDVAHRNCHIKSQGEANLVCDLIQELIAARIAPTEIGVVVPYRAQGRLIRNRLRQTLIGWQEMGQGAYRELVVDTVERMQGQEREVVLVSLTTSSPAFAEALAEFFFMPQRLNVAVTRPRTKLIIVGSRRVLEAEPENEEHQVWVGLLRDLVEQCAVYTL
ncbi:MAG: AAA family ATPase [Anaerolineales bacterium]|nr:AAA family ATPase [Anaerolineales bacterium]